LGIFSNFGDRFFAVEQQLSNISSETMAQERLLRLSKQLQLSSLQRKLIPIADGWHLSNKTKTIL
jgi:hypothetical protein